MQGCKLITSANGIIMDELTQEVINNIESKCNTPEEVRTLKCELRARQLNTLIQFLYKKNMDNYGFICYN